MADITDKINIDRWYIFECQEDKIDFLEHVKQLFIDECQMIPPDISKYLNVECLKICLDNKLQFYIKYRTKYCEKYAPDAKTYRRDNSDNTKLLINTTYGRQAKEENNMSKLESLLGLIKIQERKELEKAKANYKKITDAIILNSDVSKSLKNFVKLVNERVNIVNVDEFNTEIIRTDFLSDEDKAKLQAEHAKYVDYCDTLTQKYFEVRSLIEATDTFAEAYELLKAYGIVERI